MILILIGPQQNFAFSEPPGIILTDLKHFLIGLTLQQKTHFINSELLIRWNLDKHYLADLKAKNINIVETLFIEAGYDDSLNSLFINSGFDVAILKPAISGAARHTYKLNAENIGQHEKIFQSLIANEAMLLQPFQQEIITTGEVAFMLMGGKFTHAVLKSQTRRFQGAG